MIPVIREFKHQMEETVQPIIQKKLSLLITEIVKQINIKNKQKPVKKLMILTLGLFLSVVPSTDY
jgi:hypothetical protein